MTRNSWRRTAFASISGDVEIAPDDWTLLDPSGEPLARRYKVFGGPQDGRWYWTVLFMPDGQRRKRWNRIYSDGARGAGSLRGAHTGNDARSASIIARIPGCAGAGGMEAKRREYVSRYRWRLEVIAMELERRGVMRP